MSGKGYTIGLFFVLFGHIDSLDTVILHQNGFYDLVGLRIDTASAIKDIDKDGLIIIKANTNVTIRFFGTRLQDLANIRITKSVQSCAIGDSIATISADSLIERSPPTATLNVRFPDYFTTYYFCFEFKVRTRARADPLRNRTETTISFSDTNETGRIARSATENFLHQGSDKFRSVATAAKSWFG